MHIISLVTGVTLRAQYSAERFRVTRLAVNLFMAPVQRKFRAAVMVKMPRQPRSRDMAAFALVAERALMHVFLLVTADAGLGSFAIARSFMTRLARRRTMTTCQRKLRLVVIKKRLCPLRIGVTGHAIFAQFALVNIVFLVA